MSWAKVDDRWFHHRKVVGLSMAARGLWVTALSWSCANRTDEVPESIVHFIANGQSDDLASELVTSGLWLEADEGWVIHDWCEYQERSLTEKRAEAGAKGGKAGTGASKAREQAADLRKDQASASKPQAKSKQERKRVPYPTRPIPKTQQPLVTETVTEEDPLEGFEDFWGAWPKRNGKKLNRGKAEAGWKRLTAPQRQQALIGARNYAAASEAGLAGAMDAFRWLAAKSWPDWQEPATPSSRGRPAHASTDAEAEANRNNPAYWD